MPPIRNDRHHNHHPPSPAFKVAARMPLLAHFQHGRRFNISESDVVRWLCDQPEIQQEIFNHFKRAAAIVYLDGKWIGAETYAQESVQPMRRVAD